MMLLITTSYVHACLHAFVMSASMNASHVALFVKAVCDGNVVCTTASRQLRCLFVHLWARNSQQIKHVACPGPSLSKIMSDCCRISITRSLHAFMIHLLLGDEELHGFGL